MATQLTSPAILDQLDDRTFIDFDSERKSHVDARLSAYGDGASRWAIVIEHVSAERGEWGLRGPSTYLYYYGNAFPDAEGWDEGIPIQGLYPVEDGPSGTLTEVESDCIHLNARDLRIRGVVVPIEWNPDFYRRRNIDAVILTHEHFDEQIRRAKSEGQGETVLRNIERGRQRWAGRLDLRVYHVMRGLVPEQRELLLATEEERRKYIPPDLKLLLRLDDWQHPRLGEGERPSDSPCIRGVAEVLASGDPSRYQSAAGGGNVRWPNWPNSGKPRDTQPRTRPAGMSSLTAAALGLDRGQS